MLLPPASIPSPTAGVYFLGPVPLRGYALCIVAGIVLAVWITDRRLVARGAHPGGAVDLAFWAIPFGILGGRLYHLITTPEPYFGAGGNPLDAVKLWNGGLGIWGAVALGALGVWLGCRRSGVRFLDAADAAAPGVALAQGIGRWGNWFNNELYGERTDLPWGLVIHQWDSRLGRAVIDANGEPVVLGTFHPTFLYESVFCILLGLGLLLLDRRAALPRGAMTGLYVAGYPVGRIVVEAMRTDEANTILGLRVNIWTSVIVFALGCWIIWWAHRRASRTEVDPRPDGEISTFTS